MGTTADKLTYLNETKQELKQAINNLGGDITDNTTFRNYANQLQEVYDNLPKTEYQEGTEVTLSNTLKGKLDFDNGVVGIGQTEQDGTPTPSTPIAINSVTGNQDVVVSGKNILTLPNGIVRQSNPKIWVEDNYIYINGTPDSNVTRHATITLANSITLNGDYTWTTTLNEVEDSLVIKTNGTSDVAINLSQVLYKTNTYDNYALSSVVVRIATTNTFNNFRFKLCLAKGDDTTYEPYIQPKTYQLSLGNIELNAIGNYKDELIYDVDEDKVYKNENANEHIFTENENISLQSINSYGIANFFISHSLGSVSNLALCNYFTLQTSGISVTQEEGFLWQHNGVYFRIKSSTASDVSSFKTWLNSHSVKVEYALAETTKEEITGTLKDQIKALYNSQSFNGTTILESNGDLPMIIKVRALKGE